MTEAAYADPDRWTTPGPRGVLPPALDLDPARRAVSVDGHTVPLTAKEYLLFELLYSSRGRLFTRDDILERIWGLDFLGEARIVDAYVKRLRSKLGPGAIETVRGLGYRCPLPELVGVAQPHLQRLPPEARLLTRLAQRILQVTDPAHIVANVQELLRDHYNVREVSLWSMPDRTLLGHAGSPQVSSLPAGAALNGTDGRPDLLCVPLGTGQPDQGPWALLAFWDGSGRDGWPVDVRSALDAVAGLVNPALRLNGEIRGRELAEQQVRQLNTELERRVQARTQDLARANADLSALYGLAQELAGAANLPEVLSRGLSILAQLAGATVCSLWRLHHTELSCLGAYTPDREERTHAQQQQSAALTRLLRQSVACTSVQSVLTRTASLPDGRQVLLIPVACGAAGVHALHLELPGEIPDDLSLLDAAARSFGLAFERQTQTLMLEHVALSDELTGLPNRRALLTDLAAELSYSQRHRTSLTLSLFELPNIRDVNSTAGFAAGNDLIRALADELRRTLRLEDRMYRLSGAVVASLVRSVDLHERHALSARLNALAATFPAGTDGGTLRVSHASSPDETSELSDLLHLALARLEEQPEPPPGPA